MKQFTLKQFFNPRVAWRLPSCSAQNNQQSGETRMNPAPCRRTLLSAISLTLGLLTATAADAGGTIKFGEDKSVTIGAKLRTSFNIVENGAPNSTDYSKDFALNSIRLSLSGQVMKGVNLVFNTERKPDGTVSVLDGIAQFGFSDMFNVWAGRFLPPSDRSNLSGSYNLATWDFPFVQAYPAIFAGRDDGLALWGQTGGGKFKYQVGAFQGRSGAGTSNQSDNPLYAGRVMLNFWDPEPGYYNQSTYYGAKEILAAGLTVQTQSDGVGTAASPDDFLGWSVDALMEKKIGANVLSLEGAYYSYDTGSVIDPRQIDGDGYFVQVGYLFGGKVGPGKLQPHVRYQSLDVTGAATKHTRYDLGVNYILDGHNARMSFIFSNDDTGATSTNIIRVGLQMQI